MKLQFFLGLVALIGFSTAVTSISYISKPEDSIQCTWGPSYWCQNLTTAAGCRAVKHCIQTVWLYKQLPPDNSNVCQTCLEMVKEARDQLLSNDTQELIKEVFEGSCALLHFEVVVKECDKIADDFIPELIDTLASEMNPQTVCSVAGLCNNEKYLKLLAEERKTDKKIDKCDGCETVVGVLERKFNKMTRDQILQSFLQACGNAGSLSDGCSNIVITYFNEIYTHLKTHLNANEVCLMSGECSSRFHVHANVEITPKSRIGYVAVSNSEDDLPCELCEQLVTHLRELLVANTTEDEFKLVLQGFCKQFKSFKDECLGLVDQYYAEIYNFLVQQLDSTVVCTMTGLCPRNNTLQETPIIPLLPVQTVPKALEIARKEEDTAIDMSKNNDKVKILETAEEAQLPIERLMPPHTEVYSSETCVFCEYLLHYLQEYITKPTTEIQIKHIIDEVCSKLPASVNNTCTEFVDMYEPALVAILAQEIDPSTVCPLIKACPSDTRDIEVFMQQESDEKCPLCLFAVEKLEQMVKDKKTEANIKSALEKLCIHLPKNVASECNDFVETYTDELVEMLVADLNATEICVYLKLCSDQKVSARNNLNLGGDTMTNDIIDNTINGEKLQSKIGGSQCVVCEFVMKEIQDELKDNNTEAHIIQTVHKICNVMPKTISTECNDFVNQYGDTVIQLLIQMTVPSEICRTIGLCDNQIPQAKVEIFECAICESLVYAMEKILANPRIDHDVDHVLKKACRALPKQSQKKCRDIIDEYGTTIYNLVIHLADKGLVCKEVGLCANRVHRITRGLVGSNPCTWGPSYWCDSNENAQKCNALPHCQEKVWKAPSKP